MDLMNKVLLAGNLTRDPESRQTASGKLVAEFTLAVDPPGKGKRRGDDRTGAKAGATQDDTIFVDVVFWERTAENAVEYLHKGSSVLIEGRLRMDSWADRETGKLRRKLLIAGERLKFLNLASASPRNEQGQSRGREREREFGTRN